MTTITENLAALRSRISAACDAVARPVDTVTVVAISKGQDEAAIRDAHGAGLTDFGENYIQEALPKLAAIDFPLSWHFTGTIQANKTRAIAGHFQWAQTVSGTQVAERLSRQRGFYAGDLQVCLQLRPEPDAGRGGLTPPELRELAVRVAELPRLRLRGMMFMPLPGLDEAALRAEFRRARTLFDELRAAGHEIDTLSMGMSDDLEIAIAEGSTMVRIGTALFGARGR